MSTDTATTAAEPTMPSLPSFWLPPILAILLARQPLQFTLAGNRLDHDEMTDAFGFAATLILPINLRLPGAIPLVADAHSACGWVARFEAVVLPVSLLGPVAQDAIMALATHDTALNSNRPAAKPLEPLLIQLHTLLHDDNPWRAVLIGAER